MLEFCCGMPSLLIVGGLVGFYLTFWKSNGLIRDTLCMGANLAFLGASGFALFTLEAFSPFWALLAGNLIGCFASWVHRDEKRNRLKMHQTAQSETKEIKGRVVVTKGFTAPKESTETSEQPSSASRYVDRMLRDLDVAKESMHPERYEALSEQWVEKGRSEYGEVFERVLARAMKGREA